MSRTGGGRKRRGSGRKQASKDEPHAEVIPDEALALIAAAVSKFGRLAQHHGFDVLDHLMAMARLEADELMRLRSRRKLS
ncbi:hypothetical protein JQ604_10885 [Bradyrhizobium jicamae]|uniref:hypothetical protein n=1 Tax=Bradyrhizobium jicamae TaxID=280332 RepID=UPI001BAABB96|nr:hypothetical protein [Bradyrhizobium jicamae]MBR0752690.1 hypothetical protein [Bradyrhizobium jicamae]